MACRAATATLAPLLRTANPRLARASPRPSAFFAPPRRLPITPLRTAFNIPKPTSSPPATTTQQSEDRTSSSAPEQPQEQQASPGPSARNPSPTDSTLWRPLTSAEKPAAPPRNQAYYQLSFTCKPCGVRSHHNVTKQAYHHGSSLISCPGCRNRHVISDHLGIFGDRKVTVEDLLREKGELVKRGTLGEDGDIEFWPDEKKTEDSAKPFEVKGFKVHYEPSKGEKSS